MYAQTNRRKGRRGLLTPRIDDEACYVVNKTCSSHERHSRGLHPEHAFLEINSVCRRFIDSYDILHRVYRAKT